MSKLEKIQNDIERRIIEKVSIRSPKAENVKIVSVQSKFLNGALYTVSFDLPGGEGDETNNYLNRVYVHGRNIEVYGHDWELLAIVGATHDLGWLGYFSRPQFITSIIALCVTLFIGVWFMAEIFGDDVGSVPEFISSGFLLILGFYFGKSSTRVDN
ncbi:hypothetical protein [Phaeobacter inhibens]|uniref:hypothetical protein n=1 Tax=Phaeobacter inhibens TaxID=221822 RepID=UPI000CA36F8F|nr:hypothetical protein [Phaeobacter inhibens]AUQ55171.1 hypothetical protein PhaeoP92_02517 [Phaeobacter inhibens]AUQ79187.1 hypothetical protein PhaeoP74_02518 [Phaeobacter inhibens]AUR16346.1 hypothetical protein PhaeoP70_02516 [Phaeobacter inhibens]